MPHSPVLLLIYNRLDTTQEVFNILRNQQIAKLYIVADGPRTDLDRKKCDAVRKFVDQQVDWDCTVIKLYRDENLGCGLGVKEAVDWFFKHEEQGIILEDDILPTSDFFMFCNELLEYYKDEERIMHICAMNFCGGKRFSSDSYYFSRIINPWGWATWKRAWQKNDFYLIDLEKNIDQLNLPDYYKTELKNVKENKVIAWDYQWLYSIQKNNGYGIVPCKNLAINIGFDIDATNTKSAPKWAKKIKTEILHFPLRHPKEISINEKADKYAFNQLLADYNVSRLNRIRRIVSKQIIQRARNWANGFYI